MSAIVEERLKLLVYKYLDGSLSTSETEELAAFSSRDPELRTLISRLRDEEQLMKDLAAMEEMDIQEAQREAWQLAQEPRPPSVLRRHGRKLAGAAVLISAGLLLSFFFRSGSPAPSHQHSESSRQALLEEIHGGGARAMLTLANGQQLQLENLPTGQIATQRGAALVRTDSVLTYLPGTSADSPDTPQINTLTTPRSGMYAVVLTDGSKVWLNNASTLSYPAAFKGREREVFLSGEAFFEVAKDAGRPFIIRIKDLAINVMGTTLTIRAYENEETVTTTLLTGRLSVQDSLHNHLLEPNEQVIVDQHRGWQAIKNVDPESVLAWKNGIFYFNHADVASVMRELSRWYNIDVEMKIPETRYFYDGELSRDAGLSAILDYLTNEEVHFVRERNKVIVVP